MSHPIDLKIWYSVACDKVHFATDYDAIKTLIERIAALEAELREAKQDLQNGEAMYIAMRNRCARVEQENAQLKQQVKRLSAPVSDEEWELESERMTLGEVATSRYRFTQRGAVNRIIAARLKEEGK